MVQKAHYCAWHLWRPESKRHRWNIVYCSSIYHSQDMEATKMSIIRWMHEREVRVHNGISHTEKNWNNAVYSTIDDATDNHTTWSKSESERHISYDITYRCYVKLILMNLFPQRRTLTYSENKLVVHQMERCEECITEEIGFNRHMLILIKYRIAKDIPNTKRGLHNIL